MSRLVALPVTLEEANRFISEHHRHARPVVGARFAIGCGTEGTGLQGVAVVSRPIARMLQDGFTAEVTRCCVDPDKAQKGAFSFLYAACWRAWRSMGGRKLITYTLSRESGASLRGAGWKVVAYERLSDWSPVYGQLKLRWEAARAEGGDAASGRNRGEVVMEHVQQMKPRPWPVRAWITLRYAWRDWMEIEGRAWAIYTALRQVPRNFDVEKIERCTEGWVAEGSLRESGERFQGVHWHPYVAIRSMSLTAKFHRDAENERASRP